MDEVKEPTGILCDRRCLRTLKGKVYRTVVRPTMLNGSECWAMRTAPVQLKMREQRLRWFGHVLRRPQSHPIREAMEFEAQGKRPRAASKKRWRDAIKKDFAEAKVAAEDAVERMKWRRLTRTADAATARD
uniref:Endonuclease-reverse transcriptase HmRTE-e01 n=1 Tax=Haemonchus contortus TaxID=6289 RepID=A0A7I4Y158_HAECO